MHYLLTITLQRNLNILRHNTEQPLLLIRRASAPDEAREVARAAVWEGAISSPPTQHPRATDVVPAEPRHGEGRIPALSLKPKAAQTGGRSAEWDRRRLERCNGRVAAWMAAPALSLTEVAEDDQVGFCLRGCPVWRGYPGVSGKCL